MNKKKIFYKVVSKEGRWGSNMTGYLNKLYGPNPYFDLNFIVKEMFRKNPKIKEFFPKYEKGSKLKAPKNTPGFLCFENKKLAKMFKSKYNNLYNCIIVKITPTPEAVLTPWIEIRIIPDAMNVENFYDGLYKTSYRIECPYGSIGISELIVLE